MLLRFLMLLKDDLEHLQIIKIERKASELFYDWLLSLGSKLLCGLKITLL